MTTPMPRAARSSERSVRGWNESLGAWAVCDNRACRRARACRGNIRACAKTNFARLPQDVQDWFILLMLARDEGAPFDEAIARIGKTPLNDAFTAWRASLRSAAERGWARPQT